MAPADDQEMVFPCASVMVIMVLLKLACTCATPEVMFFFSRRRTRVLSLALLYSRIFTKWLRPKSTLQPRSIETLTSSCLRSAWLDLCAYAHWCGSSGHAPASRV